MTRFTPARPTATPAAATLGRRPRDSLRPTLDLPQMAPQAKFPHWKKEMATTAFRQAVMGEYVACFMFLFSTIGCVV